MDLATRIPEDSRIEKMQKLMKADMRKEAVYNDGR